MGVHTLTALDMLVLQQVAVETQQEALLLLV
jgi:hypothetical protein